MPLARLRSRQRWIALFSSIVLMLSALAPAVSRTLAADMYQGWVEVCTATGMHWVPLDDTAAETADAARSAPDGAPVLDHCPLCLRSAERMAPPPQLAPISCALPDRLPAPVWRTQPAHVPAEILAASPRGPPAAAHFAG